MEPLENTTEEDKLTLFMEWLLANRLQVGLAIVIALGAGAILYQKKVDTVEKEETAAEDLLAAIYPEFEVDTVDPTKAVSERLHQVAQDYQGTKAANNAVFLKASALYEEGKFTEAKVAFSSYLNLAGAGPLAAAAQFGLAASEEAVGEKEKAESSYKAVIDRYTSAPEAMQARVAFGQDIIGKNPILTWRRQKIYFWPLLWKAKRAVFPGFGGEKQSVCWLPYRLKPNLRPMWLRGHLGKRKKTSRQSFSPYSE